MPSGTARQAPSSRFPTACVLTVSSRASQIELGSSAETRQATKSDTISWDTIQFIAHDGGAKAIHGITSGE